MTDTDAVISHTKAWLSSVIIAHGLCPFAKREFENSRIHYAVIKAQTKEAQLHQLILECLALDNNRERETTLLIFPNGLSDFENYLDMADLAAALLKEQGYEGVYQLASFHPKYIFDGAPSNDAANYTNRSPYPMLHILREASVEQVLNSYPNPEKIPERNIKLTRSLGEQGMKDLLAASIK